MRWVIPVAHDVSRANNKCQSRLTCSPSLVAKKQFLDIRAMPGTFSGLIYFFCWYSQCRAVFECGPHCHFTLPWLSQENENLGGPSGNKTPVLGPHMTDAHAKRVIL